MKDFDLNSWIKGIYDKPFEVSNDNLTIIEKEMAVEDMDAFFRDVCMDIEELRGKTLFISDNIASFHRSGFEVYSNE
jgi:hypothetical protein